ncbi:MAG: DUF1624 domain-containing protein [Spirochaetes bacterium]|nr:MAG: DUF1624 domain-containing protein [Spirochaetota bacterium]
MDARGKTPRLRSLDLLRGAALAGMLVVNNQGDWAHVAMPVRHAAWHGMTPADLVFPFFLFSMGMAIPLASGATGGRVSAPRILKVLRRAALIFLLGMSLNAMSALSLDAIRIPGVLQRIAVCYLAASLIYMKFSARAVWGMCAGTLALHGAVLLFAPVPGYGAGELDPLGNICRWADMQLLAGHTYGGSIAPGMDPEGIVGTLGALGTTLLGVIAAGMAGADTRKAVRKLLITGKLLVVAGLVLSLLVPLNKQMWTPTFALVTGGIAFIVLAGFQLFANTETPRAWETPLLALGTNPLAAYVMSSVSGALSVKIALAGAGGAPVPLKAMAYNALFASWMEPFAASLAYSVCFMLLWTGVMHVLYRKRIFIRL